jgi:hypothetical protein
MMMTQPCLLSGLGTLDSESLRVFAQWNKLAGIVELLMSLPAVPAETRQIIIQVMNVVMEMQTRNAGRRLMAMPTAGDMLR